MTRSVKAALGALAVLLPHRQRAPREASLVVASSSGTSEAVSIAGASTPASHSGERGSRSLRQLVLNGLAWKILSIVVKQGSRIVVGIILARLLTPEDYGLAALVLVFSSLVFILSDLSLGAALVQRNTISDRDTSTVFWISVAAGVTCTVVGIALAGPIAGFYGEPEVKPLFIAVSFTFALVSLGATQEALLIRAMRFRALELRQMAAALVGAAVAIIIAVRGGGAWAIIVQQLVIVGVATILVWVATPWRPRFAFSGASLRELGGFGGNVFGTRLLFYLNRNADNLLIGRFLGPAALGVYALAYNVIILPLSQIAVPIEQLVYPAFSRLQDELERMRVAFLRVNRLVAAITMPLMAGLAVLAPVFVPVVLGAQWRAMTPVLQVLAIVGLVQSLQVLNGTVLLARDRSHWLLRYSIAYTGLTLIAFVAGLPFGIVGVAVALAIASAVLEPIYAVVTARAMAMRPMELVRNLSGVAQASLLMVVAVVGARLGADRLSVSEGLTLLAGVLAGALAYPPLLAWRAPEAWDDLIGMIRRRGGGGVVES